MDSKINIAEVTQINKEEGIEITYNNARRESFAANMTGGTKQDRLDLVRAWAKTWAVALTTLIGDGHENYPQN